MCGEMASNSDFVDNFDIEKYVGVDAMSTSEEMDFEQELKSVAEGSSRGDQAVVIGARRLCRSLSVALKGCKRASWNRRVAGSLVCDEMGDNVEGEVASVLRTCFLMCIGGIVDFAAVFFHVSITGWKVPLKCSEYQLTQPIARRNLVCYSSQQIVMRVLGEPSPVDLANCKVKDWLEVYIDLLGECKIWDVSPGAAVDVAIGGKQTLPEVLARGEVKVELVQSPVVLTQHRVELQAPTVVQPQQAQILLRGNMAFIILQNLQSKAGAQVGELLFADRPSFDDRAIVSFVNSRKGDYMQLIVDLGPRLRQLLVQVFQAQTESLGCDRELVGTLLFTNFNSILLEKQCPLCKSTKVHKSSEGGFYAACDKSIDVVLGSKESFKDLYTRSLAEVRYILAIASRVGALKLSVTRYVIAFTPHSKVAEQR
ncbi:hypothetical protein GOP47_0007275 [Adiantum capillus-veneris]|uniref:Uncharacterized protein n=1 Tax=Adiantum capillus-veneris TaxID=13818 RepID=A0A9D4V0Z4_ADICA|nr:hypothetical protein GOP47_0007275 [Adiantum capillus-veneris]